MYFSGSASELVEELSFFSSEIFYPNRVTHDLIINDKKLSMYGIFVETKRSSNKRSIILRYEKQKDSNYGGELTVTKFVDSSS